ncbi:MAG TPA: hypothetical protein VE153_26385 [Myxococcus sp.]|nr:hypothetical protein [Myxococcus sp.]
MKLLNTLTAALALALLLPAARGEASNYPPDYPVCNVYDTQTTGPFEVIRRTTKLPGVGSSLTVAYRGYLRGKYADNQIQLFVKLNGQYATLQANSGSYNDAYIYLNAGPRDCTMCYSQTGCGTTPPGAWMCNWPTPTEQHVFTYGWNEYYHLNAWDIEVAATANGEWDSNFGNNYHARLPARSSCY